MKRCYQYLAFLNYKTDVGLYKSQNKCSELVDYTRSYLHIRLKIYTIDGGQKDALLRRAKHKKMNALQVMDRYRKEVIQAST